MAKKTAATRPPEPASPPRPTRRVLDRVPNPHPDTNYVARFTAPEFTTLCPITGQPDFAHLVIDYVPGAIPGRVEIAEALSRPASAITAPSTRTAPSPSARSWSRCSSRNGCASAATGIRAAACRSTCSGRRANCRRTSGCRTRASRPIAAAARPAVPACAAASAQIQPVAVSTTAPSSSTGVMPTLLTGRGRRPSARPPAEKEEERMHRHRRAARGRRQFGDIDLDAAVQHVEAEAEQHEIGELDRPRHAQRDHDQAKRHRPCRRSPSSGVRRIARAGATPRRA